MAVNKVEINGEVKLDLTADTVTADTLAEGYTAHNAAGEVVTGTMAGGDIFAIIGVTYPSGSTCTCTNGTKTLKAKGTSGTAIFNVPSTGTWTVSCTNGDKTASKSVSITAEGQTTNITLSFGYVLYEAGTKKVTFTDKSTASDAKLTWGTSNATFNVPNSEIQLSTLTTYTETIDFTDYNKLEITLSSLSIPGASSSSYVMFKIGVSTSTSPQWYSTFSAVSEITKSSTTEQTITIDVSALTGSLTVFLGLSGGQGNTSTAVMAKLWLE